jgi:polyferredoxin
MPEEILHIALFVLIIIFSIIFGRIWCGKLCPLGKLQDVVYKVPAPVKITTFKGDRVLRLYKYSDIIIEIAQIILPLIGLSVFFYEIAALIPPIISWTLFGIIVVLSFILRRVFCKYFCMFGAIMSLFNKISFYKYKTLKHKCVKCGACVKVCKMNINPYKQSNCPECIRCGLCKKACHQNAIVSGFNINKKT